MMQAENSLLPIPSRGKVIFRRAWALTVAAWVAGILLAIGLHFFPLTGDRSDFFMFSTMLVGLTWGTTVLLGGGVDALLRGFKFMSIWSYALSGFGVGAVLMFPLYSRPSFWWGVYGAGIAVVYWFVVRRVERV